MKRWIPYLGVAAALAAADQLVKRWVTGQRDIWTTQGGWPRVSGFAGLTYTENPGAAFGMLPNARWFFVALAALSVAGIIFALVRGYFRSAWANWSLALILGGALGNAIDRALVGYVVDYIRLEFMEFAIFNLADICVVTGGILFAVSCTVFAPKPENPDAVESDSTP